MRPTRAASNLVKAYQAAAAHALINGSAGVNVGRRAFPSATPRPRPHPGADAVGVIPRPPAGNRQRGEGSPPGKGSASRKLFPAAFPGLWPEPARGQFPLQRSDNSCGKVTPRLRGPQAESEKRKTGGKPRNTRNTRKKTWNWRPESCSKAESGKGKLPGRKKSQKAQNLP